jgi:AraC-like DNA-binding protein
VWTTPDLLRILAVSQGLMLGAVLLRDHRDEPSARASLGLILAACAHLLLPLAGGRAPWLAVHLLAIVGSAVPFALWFLTKVHFDDEPRLQPAHLALLCGLLATCYGGWLFGEAGGATTGIPPLVAGVLPRLLGVAFVVHALLNVYVGIRSELVLQRLRLRYGVLGVLGTYMLVELLLEAALVGRTSRVMEDLHGATASLLMLGVSYVAFRLQPEILRPARVPAEPPPFVDPALADRLREALESERVWREEGLTIASLAQRLGAQEHRIRQLINSQLGFRNFNAFLNHYRVREAQKALADPGQRHRSVAEIAYDVGYASLGPFNRAFKEMNGVTPTEFRAGLHARRVADSGIGELSAGKQGDG